MGYPPSVREIGERVGLSSSSTVQSHLKTLERRGLLRRDPTKPRALVPSDMVLPSVSSPAQRETGRRALVPIVGRVAAGMPITATENIEDTFVLPASFVGRERRLHAARQGRLDDRGGDPRRRPDRGRSEPTAENGQIVVAMIDGEATVKTFYRESAGSGCSRRIEPWRQSTPTMSRSSDESRQSSDDSEPRVVEGLGWIERRVAPFAQRFGETPAVMALRESLPMSFGGLLSRSACWWSSRAGLDRRPVAREHPGLRHHVDRARPGALGAPRAAAAHADRACSSARRRRVRAGVTARGAAARSRTLAETLGTSGLFTAIVVSVLATAGAIAVARNAAIPATRVRCRCRRDRASSSRALRGCNVSPRPCSPRCSRRWVCSATVHRAVPHHRDRSDPVAVRYPRSGVARGARARRSI